MFENMLGGVHVPIAVKGTWESLAYPYTGRTQAAITAVGDEIYIYGGNVNGAASNSLLKYNTVTGVWTPLAAGYGASRGMFCGHVNGKIYFFAGVVGGNYSRITRCYDIATNVWSTMPTQYPEQYVTNSTVQVINDKIYCYGGKPLANPLGSGWIYDPALDTYTYMGTRPSGVAQDASFVVDNNLIYSAMGQTGSVGSDLVYVYNVTTKTWVAADPTKTGYSTYGVAGAIVGNKAYSFGGYPYSSRMVSFDVVEKIWVDVIQTGATKPGGRMDHGWVAVNGSIYLIGGRDNSNLSDFWKFTPAQ